MDFQSHTSTSDVMEENISIWDAFTSHMNTVYFSGASELLDKQIVAFEYHQFRSYFSV
ncbi:hypothetical protein [Draconibacterium halophilum]|uniref:Uncharacterized protein n=1 Tax=Draconibacterium halophilum TaxID=2706887 RepID=A0A6C0RCB4_9BACT|nr:hypothetical protein [Draconibacterium halophilum]QIA07123.1 hypothetical protein G0Q07_04990 [Draconibacterium halophilum]